MAKEHRKIFDCWRKPFFGVHIGNKIPDIYCSVSYDLKKNISHVENTKFKLQHLLFFFFFLSTVYFESIRFSLNRYLELLISKIQTFGY